MLLFFTFERISLLLLNLLTAGIYRNSIQDRNFFFFKESKKWFTTLNGMLYTVTYVSVTHLQSKIFAKDTDTQVFR